MNNISPVDKLYEHIDLECCKGDEMITIPALILQELVQHIKELDEEIFDLSQDED